MNSRFTKVLMFAAGAAVGSAVTWKIVKNRYERIVQEEIDSVKNVFNDMMADRSEQEEAADETQDEEEPQSQQTRIDWTKLEDLDEDVDSDEDDLDQYKQITQLYYNEEGGANGVTKEPYIIAPYDFGELDDYHTIELTYYADDILEDDSYSIVTDRDDLICPKALYTFGEYEDDAVFVRNDRLRTDFQILKDYRTYEEARNTSPNRVGG